MSAFEVLWIPVDDRAEAAALRWADDAAFAEQTTAVLSHFDSDRNAAILARLLGHGGTILLGGPGRWRRGAPRCASGLTGRWSGGGGAGEAGDARTGGLLPAAGVAPAGAAGGVRPALRGAAGARAASACEESLSGGAGR